MSYSKYAKLRKYMGGIAQNEWKKGRLIASGLAECEGGQYNPPSPGDITRWVVISGQYVCDGTTKYTKEKQQKSSDNGVTWVDTGNIRTGSIIETNSVDCGYIVQPIYQWVTISGEYVCSGTTKYSKEKQQISYDNGVTWSDTGETRTGSVIEAESVDCGGVINPGLILNGLTFSNQGYFGADNSSNYTQKTSVSVPDKLLVFDNPSAVAQNSDPWPQAGNEGQPGYTNSIEIYSNNYLFQYQGIGCKKNGKYSVFGVSVDNIIDTVTFDYSSESQVPECPYDLQIDYGVWPTSTGSWPSGWGGDLQNAVFKSGGENYSAWATRNGSTKTGAVVIHNFSKNGVFFSLPNLNNNFTIGSLIEMRKTNSTHNFAVLGIEPVGASLTRYGNLMVFDMDEYKIYRTPVLSYDQYNNNYRKYK